ncbi:MAG: hypothetical protein IPP77_13425 [Bacteroidetes bacterium]|nr:hypothetical protein [Bacteroidota bacterium]
MFASTFKNEEDGFKRKKSVVAGLFTAFLHGIILVILLFSILRTPLPPFEDNAGGMAINFGTDEVGTGDEQPFTYNPGPTEAKETAPAAAKQPEATAPEELISQETEESEVVAPKVEKAKIKPKVNENAVFKKNPTPVVNTKPSNNTKPVENVVPQPKADPNALFNKGAYGKPNNSRGDGTGGGQGDQGKPDGDPNSRNYLGDGGNGNGSGGGKGDLNGGFSLHGRNKLSLPSPQQCSSQGKVVVHIKVDKSGKVVEAVFKRFESTVFDDCNVNNALSAARKATFNADANAPDVQEGTISYIYKVR